MRSRATKIIALFAALCVPSVAMANVGTPLMWASGLHLLFGNAAIGIFEGMLLSHVFKLRASLAIGLMILANYFSAWLGWVWLLPSIAHHFRSDLYNTWGLIWGMVVVAYVFTLALEWPFVAGCFAGRAWWFRQSCVASLLVQTVSYVSLFGWYGLASGASLYTRMSVVPLDQIALPDGVVVYYIAADDGDVYARTLSSGHTEKVFSLGSKNVNDGLSFSSPVGATYELFALRESPDFTDCEEVPIGVSVPEMALPQDDGGHVSFPGRLNFPNQRDAPRLGTARDSPWSFYAGHWPIDGLRGENSRTRNEFAFARETPFAQWHVRRPIILATDKVVFQLGNRQICILDPETRKIALLAFGRAPLAVLASKRNLQNSDTSNTRHIEISAPRE